MTSRQVSMENLADISEPQVLPNEQKDEINSIFDLFIQFLPLKPE